MKKLLAKWKTSGSFENIEKLFAQTKKDKAALRRRILERYAELGLEALKAETPVDTGTTQSKWGYEIEEADGRTTITWTNDNIQDGVNVVILLQYGHATRNGGYVHGIDIVNTALKPVFEQMAQDIWEEMGL